VKSDQQFPPIFHTADLLQENRMIIKFTIFWDVTLYIFIVYLIMLAIAWCTKHQMVR